MPASFSSIVVQATMPSLSANGVDESSSHEFARFANRSLCVVAFVGLPVAVGVALVAADVFALLNYQAGFEHAIPLIQILSLHIPLVGIDMVLGSALIAVDRQRIWTVMACGAAALNILLNLVAIPVTVHLFDNGAIGAAIVTVATEVFMMVCALVLRPKGVMDRFTTSFTVRSALASLAMIPAVLLLAAAGLLPEIGIGVVVYAIVLDRARHHLVEGPPERDHRTVLTCPIARHTCGSIRMKPSISVVIPTKDRPDKVPQAVASVLANEHPSFDLTVIDQSRTRETGDRLRDVAANDPRLNYVHVEETGLSRARNAGIRQSTGSIIAFTDDDCVVPTTWLTDIAAVFESEPDGALMYGTVRPFEAGDYLTPFLDLKKTERLSRADGFRIVGMGANFAVRRRLFDTIGVFDVEPRRGWTAVRGRGLRLRVPHVSLRIRDPAATRGLAPARWSP